MAFCCDCFGLLWGFCGFVSSREVLSKWKHDKGTKRKEKKHQKKGQREKKMIKGRRQWKIWRKENYWVGNKVFDRGFDGFFWNVTILNIKLLIDIWRFNRNSRQNKSSSSVDLHSRFLSNEVSLRNWKEKLAFIRWKLWIIGSRKHLWGKVSWTRSQQIRNKSLWNEEHLGLIPVAYMQLGQIFMTPYLSDVNNNLKIDDKYL